MAVLASGPVFSGLGGFAMAADPVWTGTIPDQNWTLGIPVYLDLRTFVSDPDCDRLTFSVDQPLPPGLNLNNGVISGTPASQVAALNLIATATEERVPENPTALLVS